VFPPNRLLLIFEAREMVLFFLFCCSHPIILHSIVWSMMHGRALKRIDKKKKICVQYRSIVFLSYFFFLSFSSFVFLSDKCTHIHKQSFIFFFSQLEILSMIITETSLALFLYYLMGYIKQHLIGSPFVIIDISVLWLAI
jgi:hypothetical protein